MNWLKLEFKFYYCIVNYELKSCIYPSAQRFYYVDYIKPWIDEKPLNDYVEIEIHDFYKKMMIYISILICICIMLAILLKTM